jgi:hypothetical protein
MKLTNLRCIELNIWSPNKRIAVNLKKVVEGGQFGCHLRSGVQGGLDYQPRRAF